VAAVAGTELVREGAAGDLFYVVEAGHVEVTRAGGRVTDLGPGDYFGEIALLRDVPRSATCTATTNVELYTIDRERFVSAVTGNNTSASEIESVIHRRLGGLEAVA
jgi:CRP-like cAMP-binding protein